jgi:hypothetical protein
MADTANYVLRAEGVNFASTLYDTQDISTIRGAGLTLLALPDKIRGILGGHGIASVEDLLSGASQYACRFSAATDQAADIRAKVAAALGQRPPDDVKAAPPPFQHLCFVVDVVQEEASPMLRRAEARNHARQFREWTVKVPDFAPGTADFDPNDRLRPADTDTSAKVPPRRNGKTRLSASGQARFRYGQDNRQRFYTDKSAHGDLLFTDSFDDMVAGIGDELPLSVRGGLALFYADGNRFGDIRAAIGDDMTFSTKLEAWRKSLLDTVLAWFRTERDAGNPEFVFTDELGRKRLRFETLLWGGDEVIFVMPACLALRFAAQFFVSTVDWTIGTHRLTHTAGLVICQHKTPIRLMRDIAHALADGVKEATRIQAKPANAIGIEIFEGIMPPSETEGGLTSFRRRLYGIGKPDPAALAFPGDGFDSMLADLRDLVATDTLPRAQIYRILLAIRRDAGGTSGPTADTIAETMRAAYARRIGDPTLALPRLPSLDQTERPKALDLALIARLWDYASL